MFQISGSNLVLVRIMLKHNHAESPFLAPRLTTRSDVSGFEPFKIRVGNRILATASLSNSSFMQVYKRNIIGQTQHAHSVTVSKSNDLRLIS